MTLIQCEHMTWCEHLERICRAFDCMKSISASSEMLTINEFMLHTGSAKTNGTRWVSLKASWIPLSNSPLTSKILFGSWRKSVWFDLLKATQSVWWKLFGKRKLVLPVMTKWRRAKENATERNRRSFFEKIQFRWMNCLWSNWIKLGWSRIYQQWNQRFRSKLILNHGRVLECFMPDNFLNYAFSGASRLTVFYTFSGAWQSLTNSQALRAWQFLRNHQALRAWQSLTNSQALRAWKYLTHCQALRAWQFFTHSQALRAWRGAPRLPLPKLGFYPLLTPWLKTLNRHFLLVVSRGWENVACCFFNFRTRITSNQLTFNWRDENNSIYNHEIFYGYQDG